MLSRRAFVSAAGLAGFAQGAPAGRKICVFSKHLHFLKDEALAECAAEIGFDGLDLTVRPGGHIAPERVRQDLPRLVAIIRKQGLEVPMVTTDIADAGTPHAAAIAAAMQELGIRYYRWAGFRYRAGAPIARQIEELKPRVAKLAELNAKHQVSAMYHTHSGVDLVGASIWDLHILLRDFDPAAVGVNYDIGHATIEGGLGGWVHSLGIVGPHLRGVALKDFVWEQDARGAWRAKWTPIGEGMVAFPKFFQLLADAKFDGPLQMHFEYPIGTERAAVVRAMKRDLARIRALA